MSNDIAASPGRSGSLFGCWPWTGRRNKMVPGPDGTLPPGYGLLNIGNHEPGGEPFAYGLDGEPFEQKLCPAAYPAVTELLRNKPKLGASSPVRPKEDKKHTTGTGSRAL